MYKINKKQFNDIQLKFEKVQELREKFKIESEKQKLLIGVFSKMKESEEEEKWDSDLEDNEVEFLKKQIDILNLKLRIKSDELLQKKVILDEKNLFIEQLDQKLAGCCFNQVKPQQPLPNPTQRETFSLQNFKTPPNPITLQISSKPVTANTLPNQLSLSSQSNPSSSSLPPIPSNQRSPPNPQNTKPFQIKTLKNKQVSIKLEPDNFFSNFS